MSCRHEMRVGNVVTVVNAGGIVGGCSFCKIEAAEKEAARLRGLVLQIGTCLEEMAEVNDNDDLDRPIHNARQLVSEALTGTAVPKRSVP